MKELNRKKIAEEKSLREMEEKSLREMEEEIAPFAKHRKLKFTEYSTTGRWHETSELCEGSLDVRS